jgi:transposase
LPSQSALSPLFFGEIRFGVTVRSLPEWRSKYCHLTLRRGRKIAKVAMARKLAVRLYRMMRKEWDYEQLRKFGSHAGKPGTGDGVK